MVLQTPLPNPAGFDQDLSDLVRLSQTLGSDVLTTQGTGGNTSVKLDDDRMLIKSSGTRLMDLQSDQGWAVANYRGILYYMPSFWEIKSPEERELSYTTLLHGATLSRDRITSVEASMHAFLPSRWVAHTHSVVGQLLGLMPAEERLPLIRKALECDVRVVRPCTPGLELGREVAFQLKEKPRQGTDLPELWLLQNHGLTWAAGSAEAILTASAAFEQPLRSYFELSRYGAPQPVALEVPNPWLPPAPAGTEWHGLSFKHWPRCQFGWEPVFPEFVTRFNVWSDAPPDLIRIDSSTAFVLARNDADLLDRVNVLHAHALISTIAHERGWFRPLTLGLIRHIKEGLYERPASAAS